jgi:hypothetical protein
MDWKPFLSRKFILAVLAAVVAFGNGFFDWGLKFEEVVAIITPLIGYIAVEGAADIKQRGN